MKILQVQRTTRSETRFSSTMGCLQCRVTTIRKLLFGIIPVQTLHKYRETYYGEIKDTNQCSLNR